MAVDVKICGLSTAETVAAALDAGADLIGFAFFPKSPRNVSAEKAAELAALARGRARIVALIVDADDAAITHINETLSPDLFQAQGSETPARIAAIGQLTGKPVIKAIKVSDTSDIAAAQAYANVAGLILYDAKAPETLAGALPGGNGLAFDWRHLDAVRHAHPFMLSGGLTPETVAQAIALTGADIVDVSSGVETSPGEKSPDLIGRFIRAAKSGM